MYHTVPLGWVIDEKTACTAFSHTRVPQISDGGVFPRVIGCRWGIAVAAMYEKLLIYQIDGNGWMLFGNDVTN